MSEFQKFLMNSYLAKPLKEIEAILNYNSIIYNTNNEILKNKTVYCISPYKTGTTFLASAYDKSVSQHEPLQYLTLKKFEKDFDNFFTKRLIKLNLKLECSGFMSAYVDQLAKHSVAKDLEYIVITRKPSKWINSVINYWAKLDYLSNDYINDYFWKNKVGVDLVNFKNKSQEDQQQIIDKLLEFYFDYTKKTLKLKNVTYININDISNYIDEIDEKIGETSRLRLDKKRVTKNKFFNYSNKEQDQRYASLVATLVSKKESSLKF